MSKKSDSESSSSESEVSACSSRYDPMKALYSKKVKIPVESAPLFENIAQFEAAQKKHNEIFPVGEAELVAKREEEKEKKRIEEEQSLELKNKQRFAQYEVVAPTKVLKLRNVLTRMEDMQGPLEILKKCTEVRMRVKITTRNEKGVRGILNATVVAFDKHWNLALRDVEEIWKRKLIKKLKIPAPAQGELVPKGTAAKISPVPVVTQTYLSNGWVECRRHIPQMMVRGEHIVLIIVV